MITWGIVGNSHDASIAVFNDKELVWAALAKDFSKVDNDPHLNPELVNAAKQAGGWREPDEVIWYEIPHLKSIRQVWAGQGWSSFRENNIPKYLKQWGITCPIKFAKHHKSHAAYGWYTSKLNDATILVLDSIGEFETLTIWSGNPKLDRGRNNDKLKKVYSQKYPHSVGLFYSAMTQRLGFKANRDEYKVAELGAPIATHENLELVNNMISTFIDGKLNGDIPGVDFKVNMHKGCDWYKPELKSDMDMARLANATQFVFELIMQSNSKWCLKHLPSRNLIITGGCALNKQAVDLIRNDWDNVYIPPNPGDPGSCIGAVLAMSKKHIDFHPEMWYNN